jgi:hypothetical protein
VSKRETERTQNSLSPTVSFPRTLCCPPREAWNICRETDTRDMKSNVRNNYSNFLIYLFDTKKVRIGKTIYSLKIAVMLIQRATCFAYSPTGST